MLSSTHATIVCDLHLVLCVQVGGMQGINISFGIGAFPFAMMGGVSQLSHTHTHTHTLTHTYTQPIYQLFGNQQGVRRQPINPAQRERQQKIARVFITMAILTLILIIFS